MQDETETVCDLWEEEQLVFPPHSRLYHLRPAGVGTPRVESLTSYVTRLAEAHSIHLRALVTDEVLPLLHRSHLYQDGRPVYDHLTRFWKQSAMLNGIGTTTSDWVQALQRLTLRRDLRFLTMLPWANVLPSRGLLRRTQAWCPVCYEEWRETGQVIYQPLLWALEVISVCPYHRLRLRMRCPYTDCGHPLLPFTPRSQLGYCTRCERWLGYPSQREEDRLARSADEQEWQRWVGEVVGELLAGGPGLPVLPHQEVIAATITAHVQGAMEGNFSAFARQLQVHRRTAWEWGQGQQLPQLDALLQICFYFGTSPVHFFMGDALEAALLQKHVPGEKPISEKPKRRFRKFEAEKLQSALEAVLRDEENPPPSMREAAQRLGYDSSHLYRHFPDLCRAIAARYRAYQKELRRQRLQRICNEVQQTAHTLSAQGCFPSERQVGKRLRVRGVLKEVEVRTALYSIRREVPRKQ